MGGQLGKLAFSPIVDIALMWSWCSVRINYRNTCCLPSVRQFILERRILVVHICCERVEWRRVLHWSVRSQVCPSPLQIVLNHFSVAETMLSGLSANSKLFGKSLLKPQRLVHHRYLATSHRPLPSVAPLSSWASMIIHNPEYSPSSQFLPWPLPA
jgi:hypothetical protein